MVTYTKTGPFTDGSANPGLSAAFANNVEAALATATPAAATNLPVASGGSFTIQVPGQSGGTLLIYGTAGGAWSTVWVGVYAADSSYVAISQTSIVHTTPGQLISSVTGSTTSNTVTVQTASAGSTALFSYTLLRAGGG